ncbi:MAG: hypothetical protein ACFFCH_09810 [Promethearchaeota archaeon]
MQLNRKVLLVIIPFICLTSVSSNPVIQGHKMQASYGYAVGDEFTFKDLTRSSVDVNQTHIHGETEIQYHLQITAIDENTDGYTIRLITEILDINLGLLQFNNTVIMEGHTPIVSGPQVVFTHTTWSIHSIQFNEDAANYAENTQMSGTIEEDSLLHIYHWNLSRYIPANTSTYDMDLDGLMDSFTSIAEYTARFNDQGVLLLREFITDFRFDNGAHYYRIRQISLVTNTPSMTPSITPELGLVIGVIVIVTIGLVIVTLYWYRRVPSSLE